MTVCFLTKKFRIFGAFGKFFSLQSHLDWLIRSLLQMPSKFLSCHVVQQPDADAFADPDLLCKRREMKLYPASNSRSTLAPLDRYPIPSALANPDSFYPHISFSRCRDLQLQLAPPNSKLS